jgi:tetratricopeptide (TPR) repeat protein
MVLYENLGKAYLSQGLAAQALASYQLAADAGVNYLADSAIAANLEWRLGDRDGAMARLKALHAFAPRNIAVALALASDHYQQKDFQACLATLKTTIGKDDPAIRNLEAAALLQLGLVAQARAVIQDLLKAHSDYAPAWTNLGALELVGGQSEEAQRAFQRAVALDPHNEMARNYLAGIAASKNCQPSHGRPAGRKPYSE